MDVFISFSQVIPSIDAGSGIKKNEKFVIKSPPLSPLPPVSVFLNKFRQVNISLSFFLFDFSFWIFFVVLQNKVSLFLFGGATGNQSIKKYIK